MQNVLYLQYTLSVHLISRGYGKLLQTLKRQMSLIQLKWFTRVKLSYGIMRARAKGIVNWIGQA